jgi:hypothetical protein
MRRMKMSLYQQLIPTIRSKETARSRRTQATNVYQTRRIVMLIEPRPTQQYQPKSQAEQTARRSCRII